MKILLCSITFFFPENRAVYEIIGKTIEEPDRPQMAMAHVFACWINKSTYTDS